MEMILAFAVTLLAVILGFLSTKRWTVVQIALKLIDLFTLKRKKAGNMDSTKREEVGILKLSGLFSLITV